jgi:hypothetical protein
MTKRLFIIITSLRNIQKEHVVTARSSVLAIKSVLSQCPAYTTIVSVNDKGIVS